ncbi:MAG: cytochrome-c peroxidase, partial [Bryobacteraceae bacterium]
MKFRILLVLALSGSVVSGQPLGSLKTVIVPKPSNLSKYVRDERALIALGKALFWDVQASSDGRVACASCHFHAGADHRAQNQLANRRGSFAPNYTLTLDDYPFHKLADITNNRSTVLRDSAQIAGSSGLFRRLFSDIIPNAAEEDGVDTSDAPAFSLGGINVRRATTRNTPTVINSVFYHRNFWDGRASNIFTGATPFGEADLRANARVVSNGQLVAEYVRVDNSSLASQAVGPALNDVEMSYEGRTWPKLGKKLLGLRPLARQGVAPDDSVLGSMANPEGSGLSAPYTYLALIQTAFHPEYWSSKSLLDAGGALLAARLEGASNTSEFTQAEWNFSVFWGLAVQAYQATLVSDDSPFDRFSEGDGEALGALEQRGLNLFRGRGDCDDCHGGAEFTAASFANITRQGAVQRRGNGAFRDRGFFRIGVRPIDEDLGVGGKDDFGQPLSLSVAQNASAQNSIEGTFKAPTLRNVEFTGPYFHNGGQATL